MGRLRTDTQLAIVCVFSTVASLAIGSFAVYRLMQGAVAVALFDAMVVLVMLGGMAYAWKTGRSVMAGNVIASLLTAGLLVVIPVYGLSFLWAFSLMIGIFLMATSRVALLLSVVLIAGIGLAPDNFADPLERTTFFAVAAQVALFSFVFAWRTSRQHRQLDVMANRDPLTHVGNRRALEREISMRAEAARREGEPAGLAVIDLDHFKDVNDRHGHDAGDQVLIDLARIVGDTMRATDSFYRYGGEEFVLVMPGTTPDGISAALDKLQAAIRARLRTADGTPVTVSIGVASLGAKDDPSQWLSRADRRLYAAKAAGRDRICIEPRDPAPAEAQAFS
ncbi:GGDEF domain-containing protein [Pseudomarimonas salicorniae]|uniref:diguanylate cyclase n=1 Tax=Pseudomarimonas salicorniae TaxID=2933270 RepID=A0ABT0GL97_9GAMM|nr:GGDEF domain-containing protein [Lysobacter sp. CAU 1642]MCK7595308.1 GGDEF domain-containing protein [Lysobacter sp. CAU 1642]